VCLHLYLHEVTVCLHTQPQCKHVNTNTAASCYKTSFVTGANTASPAISCPCSLMLTEFDCAANAPSLSLSLSPVFLPSFYRTMLTELSSITSFLFFSICFIVAMLTELSSSIAVAPACLPRLARRLLSYLPQVQMHLLRNLQSRRPVQTHQWPGLLHQTPS